MSPRKKLYATHDGAKSWKEISLAAPKEILPADQPTYDLPVFEVADHGYEAVTYTGRGGKSASVLWATADGGRTWTVDEIVKDPEAVYWGKTLLSALYGLKPAEAMVLKQHLMLSTLSPAMTIKTNVPAGGPGSDYFRTGQLSFVQPPHAWGISGDGQLLSTTNSGGGNWTDITPGTHPHIPWLVGGMKMLARGKGWAMTDHGLFWTENGGKDWKDITPRSSLGPDGGIKDIFFLDTRHGWVLFAKYDEPEPKFDLSYTDNGGATWSTMHVHVDLGNLAANGRIAFADTRHGWMVLDTATSSAFNAGALFLTADGGRTWRNSPDDPGGQGPILLVTPREGWLVGNGQENDLHVTRDGAKSWQTVSFPAPKEIYPTINSFADVPMFMDKRHGFVSVTYSGPHDASSAVVLFASGDDGRTWKPDRILTNLESGFELASTVVDSNWITARVSAYQPSLTVLRAGARVRASNARWSNNTGYSQILQLSFVTPIQGWVIQDSGHEGAALMRVGDGDLLSTIDGGATWTNITPGPKQ